MTPAPTQAGLLSPSAQRALLGLAGFGLVVTLFGWILDRDHAAAGLLVAGQFAIGISLAGLAFLVFTSVAKAGWATAIRRVPEAMARSGSSGRFGMAWKLEISE